VNISAKIIEDSLSPEGIRLTTLQLCYQRFIHSEVMTHRVFSRNAMSSRAVPVAKMIEQVRKDPAMPVHWGANQPGMQAHAELTGPRRVVAQSHWQKAAAQAAGIAESMELLGLHKQVANRILEPFQWMHVIVTATEWGNFFELRDHIDAEPNIQVLARAMKAAMAESKPKLLTEKDWHLPYITDSEREYKFFTQRGLAQISAARCARVSYLTHEGKLPNIAKDLELYERLVGSSPLHASPVEHQAWPDRKLSFGIWDQPELHGNLRGWCQFRKLVELDFRAKAALAV